MTHNRSNVDEVDGEGVAAVGSDGAREAAKTERANRRVQGVKAWGWTEVALLVFAATIWGMVVCAYGEWHGVIR